MVFPLNGYPLIRMSQSLYSNGTVSFKMSHIESKSIHIWLRYDPKYNLTICKECGLEVRLHFGSYLSQMLMDFASIWLMLSLIST